MRSHDTAPVRVAIACGGTGGHLFPGVAVAEKLAQFGAEVQLLVSEKEIDRIARQSAPGLRFAALPGGGFVRGRRWSSLMATWRGFRQASRLFQDGPPDVVLSMGGFAGVAPVLAARRRSVPVVLHEANAVPGKATRWLSGFAKKVLITFQECEVFLRHRDLEWTGMPVREAFGRQDREQSRRELGLDPAMPVLLVMGGSQGAAAINDLYLGIREGLARNWPELQVIHLTGPADFERVRSLAGTPRLRTILRPFEARMECILAASNIAIARAGASSIAECAACALPSILIPYPFAADDHQRRNAEAAASWGGARVVSQAEATPSRLLSEVLALRDDDARVRMELALGRFAELDAAAHVARSVLDAAGCCPGSHRSRVEGLPLLPTAQEARAREGVAP